MSTLPAKNAVSRKHKKSLPFAGAFVFFIWLASAAFSLQSFRGYMPNFDLIPDQGNAYELIEDLNVPDRGCISSFGGWNPPGVTFAFLPGSLFAPQEPILGEKIGALIMWAITLAGFFMVLKRINNPLPLLFAILIFAFSADGIFYSSSLWPRAHPAFYAWFTFFTLKWIADKNAGALAAALLVWMLGMYWFMEIAMLIAVLPVAWLIYRPPFRFRPLLLAVAISLVMWSPFLIFQVKVKGFDLQRNLIERKQPLNIDDLFVAQLGNPELERITRRPAGWQPDWSVRTTDAEVDSEIDDGRYISDPVLGWVWTSLKQSEYLGGSGYWYNLLEREKAWAFQRLDDGAFYIQESNHWKRVPLKHFIHTEQAISPDAKPIPLRMASALLKESILRIFPRPLAPWWSCLFGTSIMTGLILLNNQIGAKRKARPYQMTLSVTGFVASLAGVVIGLFVVGSDQPAGAFLAGACGTLGLYILKGFFIANIRPPTIVQAGEIEDLNHGLQNDLSLLVVILFLNFLIPYLLTAALIAPGEWGASGRRFFWLTGGGCALIASASWLLVDRSKIGRIAYTVLACFLLWGTIQQSGLYHAWQAWISTGFSLDKQHECYDVMAWLADDIRSRGISDPSIGYDVSFPAWLLSHRYYAGGTYKVGMDFDFVLKHRYGIKNRNQLAEGICYEDDYRIVEIKRWDPPWDWPFYFDLSSYPQMQIVKSWGQYVLLSK